MVDNGLLTGQVHLVSTDALLSVFLANGHVKYIAPRTSTDAIMVQVSDNGFSGLNMASIVGGSVSNLANTTINVTVVAPLAPVLLIVVDSAVIGNEDNAVSLAGSISLDPRTASGSDIVEITFVSTKGFIIIDVVSGGNVVVTGTENMMAEGSGGSQVVTARGSIAEVQRMLTNLTYVPVKDASSDCNVVVTLLQTVSSSDSELVSSSQETVLKLFLVPINDAPVIHSSIPLSGVYYMSQGDLLDLGSLTTGGDLSRRTMLLQQDETAWTNSSSNQRVLVSRTALWSVSDVDLSDGPPRTNRDHMIAKLQATCGSLLLSQSLQLLLLNAAGSQLLVTPGPVYLTDTTTPCSSSSTSGGGENSGTPLGFRSYTLQGELEMINAALASMTYLAPGNYTGLSQIVLEVNDDGNFGVGGEMFDQATLQLSINASQAPAVPLATLSVTLQLTIAEGTASFSLTQMVLGLTELSGAANVATVFNLTVVSNSGLKFIRTDDIGREVFNMGLQTMVSVPSVEGATVWSTSSVDVGMPSYSVMMTGTASALLTALQASTVTLPGYFHGTVSFAFEMFVASPTSNEIPVLVCAARSVVVVTPENNAPVVVFNTPTATGTVAQSNASYIAQEDTPFYLPAFIYDPDVAFLQDTGSSIFSLNPAGCCTLRLNISCTNCFLSQLVVVSTPSAIISAPRASSVTLVGTVDEINAAMLLLLVTGNDQYSGPAVINVVLDDRGSYGSGESYIVEDSLDMFIEEVNDPPSIVLPASTLVVVEPQMRVFANGSSVRVFDRDAMATDVVNVSLSCDYGSILLHAARVNIAVTCGTTSVSTSSDVTTTHIEGSAVCFSVATGDVNTALANIIYQPDPSYVGLDRINVTATDALGASSSKVIVTIIREVHARPVLTLGSNETMTTSSNAMVSFPPVTVTMGSNTTISTTTASGQPLLQLQVTPFHSLSFIFTLDSLTVPYICDINCLGHGDHQSSGIAECARGVYDRATCRSSASGDHCWERRGRPVEPGTPNPCTTPPT